MWFLIVHTSRILVQDGPYPLYLVPSAPSPYCSSSPCCCPAGFPDPAWYNPVTPLYSVSPANISMAFPGASEVIPTVAAPPSGRWETVFGCPTSPISFRDFFDHLSQWWV